MTTTSAAADTTAVVDNLADPARVAELAALAAGRRLTGLRAGFVRSPALIVAGDAGALVMATVVTGRFRLLDVVYLLMVPAWFSLIGSYRSRIAPSLRAEVVAMVGGLACPMLVLAAIGTAAAHRLLDVMPVLAALIVGFRAATYALQRWARARTAGEPVLIVGAGVLGCQLAHALQQHPEYGLEPAGFVDGFPDDHLLPLPILGDIHDLDRVVRATRATRMIIAFGANRESDMVAALRASAEIDAEVHILPRLFELGVAASDPSTDLIWGFPIRHARRAALRTPAWRTKRVVDILASGIMLVVASPVMAAAAAALKLSGQGPVLFRQLRVGQRGHPVEILKFRTMRVNDESDTRWGTLDDDRITRVGRMLRATNVDELPQLINVLKGDMSLVGPRPERPHFAEQFDSQVMRYRDRLRVPVGLTGWAQVHGLRGDTSIEERARFDNYYIEHWSLWFDLAILGLTVSHLLRHLFGSVRHALHADTGAPVETPGPRSAELHSGG